MSRQEAPHKTVLVFGPQALAFNQDSFHKLRASIVSGSTLGWVLSILEELPSLFDKLCAEFPELSVLPGVEQLQDLSERLNQDSSKSTSPLIRIPNIVLTPLCVISQLAAYYKHVKPSHTGLGGRQDTSIHPLANTETVGFCTGLLAALVVSLSTTDMELEHHGAIALRLAMLIGATVDAEDALDGGSTSFSAGWRTQTGISTLEEILQDYEDVSIVFCI